MIQFLRNRISFTLLLAGCLLLGATSSPAAVVDETLITAKVTAHVKEKLGVLVAKDDQQYVSVNVLRVPNFDFPKSDSASSVGITLESNLDTTYSERAVIRVTLQEPQGPSREIGVPVKISIKKPVWVAKHPIRARQPLKLSDFTLQVRDVSHTYSYAVGAERPLGQYISRVNINAGDTLDSRKIVIPPDVVCNNQVRILISNGNGMVVAVPGIAMANGRVGETIRVRQAVYQRKYYSAKIIDKNQVLVEM